MSVYLYRHLYSESDVSDIATAVALFCCGTYLPRYSGVDMAKTANVSFVKEKRKQAVLLHCLSGIQYKPKVLHKIYEMIKSCLLFKLDLYTASFVISNVDLQINVYYFPPVHPVCVFYIILLYNKNETSQN